MHWIDINGTKNILIHTLADTGEGTNPSGKMDLFLNFFLDIYICLLLVVYNQKLWGGRGVAVYV